jgi:hypothetical protein
MDGPVTSGRKRALTELAAGATYDEKHPGLLNAFEDCSRDAHKKSAPNLA